MWQFAIWPHLQEGIRQLSHRRAFCLVPHSVLMWPCRAKIRGSLSRRPRHKGRERMRVCLYRRRVFDSLDRGVWLYRITEGTNAEEPPPVPASDGPKEKAGPVGDSSGRSREGEWLHWAGGHTGSASPTPLGAGGSRVWAGGMVSVLWWPAERCHVKPRLSVSGRVLTVVLTALWREVTRETPYQEPSGIGMV